MKKLYRTLMAFVLLPHISIASETKITQATHFLKDACVTSGSTFELKATGNGSFQVKRLLGTSIAGSVILTKKELQGFADAASALSAQQATEMRNCMKPHIDKILNAILNQP